MRTNDVFKVRMWKCACGWKGDELRWESDGPLPCPLCGTDCQETYRNERIGVAPAVHGDECDVLVRHGVCNPDGSPRRFRSKSELKQAAWESGYTQGDDTPKPNQKIVEERQAKDEARAKL